MDDYVSGLLLVYPAFDNKCSDESLRRFGGAGAVLTGEEVDYFWANYAGDTNVQRQSAGLPHCAPARGPAARLHDHSGMRRAD